MRDELLALIVKLVESDADKHQQSSDHSRGSSADTRCSSPARFCTASHRRSGPLLMRFGRLRVLTLIPSRIALSGILRGRRQCVHVDVAFVSQ